MINVLFHDDWEINGDGTGDPEKLMFEPARKLLDLCDQYGARYTFFAEVMQQLSMLESEVAEHRQVAKRWEEVLRDAVRRGHDVQLHLHPQWSGAHYSGGKWQLELRKWSIAGLEERTIFELLEKGKRYLESVLGSVRADYRVVAFRAGGWMAQPSRSLIRALRQAGIAADCSVVPGKRMSYSEHGSIDYSRAGHRLLPWWTNHEDVATIGTEESGVLELPSFSEEFHVPLPVHLIRSNLRSMPHYWRIYGRKKQRDQLKEYTPRQVPLLDSGERFRSIWGHRSTYCSFGYMHYRTIMRMVRNARALVEAHELHDAPLVMLTHSKSFFSYANFEKLLQQVSREPDICFSRTRDYVRNLASGGVPGLPLSALHFSSPGDPAKPDISPASSRAVGG